MKKYNPDKIQFIWEVYPIETPCTKMMYKSESEARAAILYLKEEKGIKDLLCYACMKCGFYHLTRK